MRHVTDGELHAYLDGALDSLAQGRGEEVREHLDDCAACRERLQDETRTREVAQGLLSKAAPPEVELPPFEAIRARAEAAAGSLPPEDDDREIRIRHRGPLRGLPLAWAATVVLALGVGWMGGEIWRTLPQDGTPAFSGTPTTLQPAELESGTAEIQRSRQPEVGSDQVDQESLVEGTEDESSGVPSDQAVATMGVDSRSDAPSRNLGLSSAQLPEPELQPAPDALETLTPVAREKATEERGQLLPTATGRMGAEASTSVSAADPGLARAQGMAADNSLAVPGLEVLSVEWEEWIPGERSLHIRQLLPMGDTLELRYLGMLMGTDPKPLAEPVEAETPRGGAALEHPPFPKVMEASLPPGWNQVVMRKSRGWLVARAPLSVEGIRAILRALR